MKFNFPTRLTSHVGFKRYLARASLAIITTIGVLGHVAGYWSRVRRI